MIRKRSIAIAGHRTSISLEDAFWQALQDVAAHRGISLPALVAEIDGGRDPAVNLSSAIRIAMLNWYRSAATSR
ncbi:Ribbon-helix-helix domain-containing protein [Kaistia soli DSM 19436]|uniref:Ribbon-helix-helix domain-containing protein n=1 Tax=Kaistia soli DSM 19436 TaxID=1122133 RepID=A0A1M5A1C0_9HYPH|nr:ribbon-helix-helix domain-containing protein [Kaistia soli]SHF23927.1 Ribbon-helix-helix domain-containing protein [Kaistia soli DSM 19436]